MYTRHQGPQTNYNYTEIETLIISVRLDFLVCVLFSFSSSWHILTHEESRRTEMLRVSTSGDKSYFLVGSTSNRILLLKSRLSDVIRINTDGPPNIFSFYKKYVVEFVENSSSPKFLLMSKSVKEKKRCSSGWTRNNQFV